MTLSLNIYRNQIGIVAALTAIGSLLVLWIGDALSSNQLQMLLLGGVLALLIMALPGIRQDQRSAVFLLSTAITLAIASRTAVLNQEIIIAMILTVTGASLVWQLGLRDLPVLIAGSAIVVMLLLIIDSTKEVALSSPSRFLAATSASICAALTIGFVIQMEGTFQILFLPATIGFAGATLVFALLSTGTDNAMLPNGLICIGIAYACKGIIPRETTDYVVTADPNRFSPIILMITTFVFGSALLAVLVATPIAIGSALAGASVVGLVGTGALAIDWWKCHRIRLDHLDRAANESRIDQLTKLKNRRGIDERIVEEIDRARRYDHPLSILMIDLDDFKSINDRFGHVYGDEVLVDTARVIATSIRSIDVAGRYGGEEILVILPETTASGARIVAERIRATVESLGSTTVSIGIDELDLGNPDFMALIEQADRALYTAKRSGKNRIALAG